VVPVLKCRLLVQWYKGLDKLIHYGNTMYSGQVNIFYSNPTQYTQGASSASYAAPNPFYFSPS
jgi:hypothetical protein